MTTPPPLSQPAPPTCPVSCCCRCYTRLTRAANLLQPLVLLLLRLWGLQFMLTGWGKLQHHDKVVHFFTSLGIPAPAFNAWFVGGVECFGGILLLLGLLSRPAALLLAINMLVAFLSVPDDRNTFLHAFSDPDKFIAADPFFYLLVAVIILAFGPGLLSLDAILARLLRKPKPPQNP